MPWDQVMHRFATAAQLADCCRDGELSWLGPAEQAELAMLRDCGRRITWLGGRWIAKQLIETQFWANDASGSNIQILSRNAAGQGTRPRVQINGAWAACSLSISHTASAVLVACLPTTDVSLGVDLVEQQPLSEGFQKLWFTERERNWLANQTAQQAVAVWAVKESFYKAANAGQSWSPQQTEVRWVRDNWFLCRNRAIGRNSAVRVESGPRYVAALAIAGSTTALTAMRHSINRTSFGNQLTDECADRCAASAPVIDVALREVAACS